MELLLRRPTKTTPYVHLDNGSGIYVIAGRSIPIDAELFYNPVLNWIECMSEVPPAEIQFCFRFDFFNIASSKRILFILYKLVELQKTGTRVTVNWMYEKFDEDMLEIGQDYSCMIDELPFKFESYDLTELNESRMLKFG